MSTQIDSVFRKATFVLLVLTMLAIAAPSAYATYSADFSTEPTSMSLALLMAGALGMVARRIRS